MFLILFLHRNNYRPKENGVDMPIPVHPVAKPLKETLKSRNHQPASKLSSQKPHEDRRVREQ